jgi:hypothetical protein
MVEGLTSSATDQGSVAGGPRAPCPQGRLSGLSRDRRSIHRSMPAGAGAASPNDIQTHQILVTLAERPHPFPSRTRKLSSPAPKILRGQPFGNIGRRQDFCVSGLLPGPFQSLVVARRGIRALLAILVGDDDDVRSGSDPVRCPGLGVPLPAGGPRPVAPRDTVAGPPLWSRTSTCDGRARGATALVPRSATRV